MCFKKCKFLLQQIKFSLCLISERGWLNGGKVAMWIISFQSFHEKNDPIFHTIEKGGKNAEKIIT